MTMEATPDDLERFRALLGRWFGLQFQESRLPLLAEVLERRSQAQRTSASLYLERLESKEPPAGERGALAAEVTVGETYFFRNSDQFRAFAEVILPGRLAARTGERKLKLLSAGCASGEEAYSLAIIVRQRLLANAWDISITGVDANPVMLDKANRGRFSSWSLRETPADVRERWFSVEGREYVLDDGIRRAVTFQQRNLVEDDPELWRPATYDVIFCRNVLMYFAPEQASDVVARIARSLVPGGYLFLGHAETLRGLSHDFDLRHTCGAFYYQLKQPADAARVKDEPREPLASSSATGPAEVDFGSTWIDTIRRAAERIHALSATASGSAAKLSPARPQAELGAALRLLGEERFAEAFELLQAIPREWERDADVLLLRAVLLVHRGELAEAERTCRELLEIDPMSAGAHYSIALCREAEGDVAGAAEEDQMAAYLDPSFAMPHLHLGLLARRGNDPLTSRREFGHALVLLQREDASRLLLFGGGFGRETLVALCRAELQGSRGDR
jgi:chemotaxis protein methyltransferase CheR